MEKFSQFTLIPPKFQMFTIKILLYSGKEKKQRFFVPFLRNLGKSVNPYRENSPNFTLILPITTLISSKKFHPNQSDLKLLQNSKQKENVAEL
jgi:hypothetical protein